MALTKEKRREIENMFDTLPVTEIKTWLKRQSAATISELKPWVDEMTVQKAKLGLAWASKWNAIKQELSKLAIAVSAPVKSQSAAGTAAPKQLFTAGMTPVNPVATAAVNRAADKERK